VGRGGEREKATSPAGNRFWVQCFTSHSLLSVWGINCSAQSHIHVCIHVYMCTCVRIHVYVYMYTCVHVYMMCLCAHTYVNKYMHEPQRSAACYSALPSRTRMP